MFVTLLSSHVSSINMPIFRRKDCIHTASGIFALCKSLHSTLVESGFIVTYIQNKIETRVYLELMGNTHLFVRRYFHIQNVQ
jgi:hypothetical protein